MLGANRPLVVVETMPESERAPECGTFTYRGVSLLTRTLLLKTRR